MKKLLSILLIIVLVALTVGCNTADTTTTGSEIESTTTNFTTPQATTQSTSESVTTTQAVITTTQTDITTTQPIITTTAPSDDVPGYIDDPSEDDDYRDLECTKVDDFVMTPISFEGSDRFISLPLSKNLKLFKGDEENSYDIYYFNRYKIGKIFKGSVDDLDVWKNVYSRKRSEENFVYQRNIDKYGTGDTLKFRHRFYFKCSINGEMKDATLIIDFQEIRSVDAQSLYNEISYRLINSEPNKGCIDVKNPSRILIIGNSFVNSSNIGPILDEMLSNNGKNCEVNAISRGYATVKTYSDDANLMNQIRNGMYDIVFVCGFYSEDEINNLAKIHREAEKSNTKIVVFPAHNEGEDVAKKASKIDDTIVFLNWKGEINTFITNGVNRWDLCINDAHFHSTPLAGYIGAHMIYRGIYGSAPANPVKSTISSSLVKSKLGSYTTTGIIVNAAPEDIYYFN